jgi:hypothetical protein
MDVPSNEAKKHRWEKKRSVSSIRSSTGHGSSKALVIMVLDASYFGLDTHIGDDGAVGECQPQH